MKLYKNVLLALALEEKSDEHIIKKAHDLKEQYQATLTIIHGVEYLLNYGAAYAVTPGIEVEQEMVDEAKKLLNQIGKKLAVPESHQIIKVGSAKQIILEQAKHMNADLIIIGSHGRHGWRLLLGSTANAVLHSAECDVLAIRVK